MRPTIRLVTATALAISPGAVHGETTITDSDWDVDTLEVRREVTGALFSETEIERRELLRDPTPEFSKLGDNQWIEIYFESNGCFHSEKRKLRVYGGDRPRVEVDARSFVGGRVRSLDLSRDDLVGLDRLLVYYETPRDGGCTTTEKLDFRWKEGGGLFSRTTKSRRFEDASCGDWHYSDVLWIWDLVRRAEQMDAV